MLTTFHSSFYIDSSGSPRRCCSRAAGTTTSSRSTKPSASTSGRGRSTRVIRSRCSSPTTVTRAARTRQPTSLFQRAARSLVRPLPEGRRLGAELERRSADHDLPQFGRLGRSVQGERLGRTAAGRNSPPVLRPADDRTEARKPQKKFRPPPAASSTRSSGRNRARSLLGSRGRNRGPPTTARAPLPTAASP